jgi:uncharacterized protein
MKQSRTPRTVVNPRKFDAVQPGIREMDLVWLIDYLDEPLARLAVGAFIGLAFGVLAQRTGFCTRSMIIELFTGRSGSNYPLWLAAFGAAVAGTQALIAADMISVSETRYFATPLSLSGALFGGALFGVGMMLARGCVSRQIVLAASGNLRSLFCVTVIALAAFVTLGDFAAPVRNAIAGAWSTAALGSNDVLVLASASRIAAIVAGLVILGAAATIAYLGTRRLSPAIWGLAVGLTVPVGWYLVYSLSIQVFEPFQADSLSYIRPLAGVVELAGASGSGDLLSVDIGIVLGTFVGALLSALLSGGFSLQGFADSESAGLPRYLTGALMMGFGGVLAAGCTIGAGLTGGSVLSLASLVSLGSMVISAGITAVTLETRRTKIPSRNYPAVPAE